MLLVHQAGSVKVGEIQRYTLTYVPSNDRILPTPSVLHLRIRNTCALPLRLAYVHGPYGLHVSAYPSTFNPHDKVENAERDGLPQYEPMLKASGSWDAKLKIPDDIRESISDLGKRQSTSSNPPNEGEKKKSVTWIIEVASQILFSTSASVEFEILIGRDENSLDMGFAAVAAHGHGRPGQVKDIEKSRTKSRKHEHRQSVGVFSKAVRLLVEDTEALWDKPALPTWQADGKADRKSSDTKQNNEGEKPRKRRKIHLVVVTHGLHSNTGADMLFMKESIDATVKEAREDSRKRKQSYRAQNDQYDTADSENSGKPSNNEQPEASTAPLSGGQEEIGPDDDEEETIVRGFSGNAVKTENGIQYLGKRLAKYILKMTYPDQPFLPVKKSLSRSFTDNFKSPAEKANRDGQPSHSGSSVHLQKEQSKQADAVAYQFTSISFIGHSLGGLIQTYAIAYIQKHSPTFFTQIKPVNFITMAAPMLGLSNENPMYVKFALDFGLVGRTGQDLGLTWRPPALKGGWNAMFAGLNPSEQKSKKGPDPGSKPLLRILPTGPAHQVLRMFRNRTVYSNVVNDGIVPLRTSCLLFLDWRGLGKVEKARRENGLFGTVAEWGWAELTGTNVSSIITNIKRDRPGLDNDDDDDDDDNDNEHVRHGEGERVPLPSEDATADDNNELSNRLSYTGDDPAVDGDSGSASPGQKWSNDKGMLDNFLNFFRPNTPSGASTPTNPSTSQPRISKKQLKALRRAQTVNAGEDELPDDIAHGMEGTTLNPTMRPHLPHQHTGGQAKTKRPAATKGDSYINEQTGGLQAPPKTSIFEAAGDLLHPPLPSIEWISDPSTRARTIFHDRVYHPEDIPPPPAKRQGSRLMRSISGDTVYKQSLNSNSTGQADDVPEQGGMRVEEKIARAYHHDLSWRKVLVRLEPDAHNNMIVRRMFANAYGWPVIKHLCDTHFSNTYAAQTRDEDEPAKERALPVDEPVPSHGGEEVKGQTDKQAPKASADDMREAKDELRPLNISQHGSFASQNFRMERQGSAVWDDSYLDGSDGDDSDIDERGFMQKLINPQMPRKPEQAHHHNHPPQGQSSLSQEPKTPYTDGHRGLAPVSPVSTRSSQTPLKTRTLSNATALEDPTILDHIVPEPEPIMSPPGNTAELGLRKSLEERVTPTKSRDGERPGSSGITEAVSHLQSSQDKQ